MFEMAEMFEFTHLQLLLGSAIACNEPVLIRMYFSFLVERYVQYVHGGLYDWIDPFASPSEPSTFSSTFPFFAPSIQTLVSTIELPEWNEPVHDVSSTESIIRARSLHTLFVNKETHHLPLFAETTKRCIHEWCSKYGKSVPLESVQWQTILYRFVVGMANSSFFRSLLEQSKHLDTHAGILYFLKWQPAILCCLRSYQKKWVVEKCYKWNKRQPHRELYTRLLRRFHGFENKQEQEGKTINQRFRMIRRCKQKETQRKHLYGFVSNYPSLLELRTISTWSSWKSLFPEREDIQSVQDESDCQICFQTISFRHSLGMFTGCGHFFCVECALRSCFEVPGNNELQGLRPKPPPQCWCPSCRTTINGPQTSLPSIFIQLPREPCSSSATPPASSSNWSVPVDQLALFSFPIFYVVDLAETELPRKKRKRALISEQQLDDVC